MPFGFGPISQGSPMHDDLINIVNTIDIEIERAVGDLP